MERGGGEYRPKSELPEGQQSQEEEPIVDEKRTDLPTRTEVQGHKEYLTETAIILDSKITLDAAEHEIATMTAQIRQIWGRLVHCCGGQLDRDRANGIMDEIIGQMVNEKTKLILRNIRGKSFHERHPRLKKA